MQPFTDHYRVLGVSSYANEEEIKKAYRQIAKRCHPDVTQTPASAQDFIEVNNAYKTLIDPVKRCEYDHQRFAQSQIKTAVPSSQRTSHASSQWQARPSSQRTSHASYQWQAAQDGRWDQSSASSTMHHTADSVSYDAGEGGCCLVHVIILCFFVFSSVSAILSFLFPPTITITATGFDQISPSQNNTSVVFKNDLRIPVILCLGTNRQCNLHATDPSELASPGLTIRPGSSEYVYFTAGNDYHITIVSLSNKLPHVNLDLTIQQDGGGN